MRTPRWWEGFVAGTCCPFCLLGLSGLMRLHVVTECMRLSPGVTGCRQNVWCTCSEQHAVKDTSECSCGLAKDTA